MTTEVINSFQNKQTNKKKNNYASDVSGGFSKTTFLIGSKVDTLEYT